MSQKGRAQKGSISALCRKHGVSRRTFYTRREAGWTEQEALGIEERRHNWQTADHAEINRILRAWR
jgi:hypothetical protein